MNRITQRKREALRTARHCQREAYKARRIADALNSPCAGASRRVAYLDALRVACINESRASLALASLECRA